MHISLKEKTTQELQEILKERMTKFNTFKTDYIVVAEDEINYAETNESALPESNDTLDENKAFFEIIRSGDNEDTPVEQVEIDSNNKKEDAQRSLNPSMDTTKTYNMRMKGGYFGRRRSR